ncbi:MAG: ribonuclease E inhibitor RraB [Candidatus Obscuribacterales bacterium]|nr:ribonuclease E inhibitor RraB [Candidatus Obscuribacterales bacterium]
MARYRLKTMVLARILAEATVCTLFVAIPVCLQLNGALPAYPAAVKAMLWCLAGIGAVLLPWFGFITWLVTTTDTGLTTHSLLKNHTLEWSKITNLSRRSSWAWLRFVVEAEDDELSFPVLLSKIDDLVTEITNRLPPSAGRLRSTHRHFIYDRLAFALQFLQSLAAVVFAIVFWFFFVARMHFSHNNTDTVLLLVFCAAITLVFAWRMQVVAAMPRSIETTKAGLVITTYLGKRMIAWADIKRVGLPMPLLPEGFTVKTSKGTILVGAAMECADELQSFIKSRVNGAGAVSRPGGDIEDAVNALNFDEIKARIEEQFLRSQDLLNSLREQNIDTATACEVDHCFYADTHHAITGLGQNLADQGFEVDVFAPIEADGVKIDYWTMKVRVSQSPEDAGAEKNAAFMMGLADEYACVYDGWSPDLPTTK